MPRSKSRKSRKSRGARNPRYRGQLSKRVETSPAFKRYLRKKINLNMEEYHQGRWVSPQQAVAVSYSQTRKKFARK